MHFDRWVLGELIIQSIYRKTDKQPARTTVSEGPNYANHPQFLQKVYSNFLISRAPWPGRLQCYAEYGIKLVSSNPSTGDIRTLNFGFAFPWTSQPFIEKSEENHGDRTRALRPQL